jgi:hypothetical protein
MSVDARVDAQSEHARGQEARGGADERWDGRVGMIAISVGKQESNK